MTDLEINKALALAIGWEPEAIMDWGDDDVVIVRTGYMNRYFNYRDWRVIGPIAEKYDCFPIKNGRKWCAYVGWDDEPIYADTPQKAIALAVIATSGSLGAKK